MRTPEIMEAIVRERIVAFPPDEVSAFAQGIACSVVIRQDTVRDEAHTVRFVQHVPAADFADLWERIVGRPSRQALYTIHPRLRAPRRLEEIACYRPLEEFLPGAKAGQDRHPA